MEVLEKSRARSKRKAPTNLVPKTSCRFCGRPIKDPREKCCGRCDKIRRTRESIAGYLSVPSLGKVQRELYRPVPEAELIAIATCNADLESQKIMDEVIRRETARIRQGWCEADYQERSGQFPREAVVQTAPRALAIAAGC